MRTRTTIAGAALGALAVSGFAALPRAANDVSVTLKAGEIATAGPVATIRLVNRGTSPQAGVTVRVFANEDHTGTELWSGTVDLLPGKAVRLRQQVWVDGPVECLCATAELAGVPDERPGDNVARRGLVERGKVGMAFAGRQAFGAHCASCHGALAEGGAGPALVGARAPALIAKAAEGGDHDFPWLGRGDGRVLQAFLRSPSTVPQPDYPVAPLGGWPTYSGSVKSLFDENCIRCHGAGRAENGIRLHTWEGAWKWARPALFQIRIGAMPQGGRRLANDEIQLLEDWILGGRRP